MIKKTLDWQNKEIVDIYDEVPLWSAPYGNLLLENIPMQPNWTIVDLGFGTGFPLIELAQRYGESCTVIGVDIWKAAIERTRKKIALLELNNVEIIEADASEVSLQKNSVDLVCSNLGVNNFTNKEEVFQNVSNMLKPNGYFCLTTNNQTTFYELFDCFEQVIKELELDTEPLNQYRNSRTSTDQLITDLADNHHFIISKQIDDVSSMRFSSGAAIFNHSLMRIAFLDSWKNLITQERWDVFYDRVCQLIDVEISKKSSFKITKPLTYLEFINKK